MHMGYNYFVISTLSDTYSMTAYTFNQLQQLVFHFNTPVIDKNIARPIPYLVIHSSNIHTVNWLMMKYLLK